MAIKFLFIYTYMNNESLALLTGLLTSLLLYSYAFSFEKLFLPRIITPVGWSQCPRTLIPRSHVATPSCGCSVPLLTLLLGHDLEESRAQLGPRAVSATQLPSKI